MFNELFVKVFSLFLTHVDIELLFFHISFEAKAALLFEFSHKFHPRKVSYDVFVCHADETVNIINLIRAIVLKLVSTREHEITFEVRYKRVFAHFW